MGTWTEYRNKEKGPNERERSTKTIALPSLVMQDDAPTNCFEQLTKEVLSGEEQRMHLLIVACTCLRRDGTAASVLQKRKHPATWPVARSFRTTPMMGAGRCHGPICAGQPTVAASPRSHCLSEDRFRAHDRRTRDLCGPFRHRSP